MFKGLFRAIGRALAQADEEPRPDEIVFLASTFSLPLAEMWRGMLESAGIRSMLQGGARIGYMAGPSPPFKLYVFYRDLARAEAVIAEVDDASD